MIPCSWVLAITIVVTDQQHAFPFFQKGISGVRGFPWFGMIDPHNSLVLVLAFLSWVWRFLDSHESYCSHWNFSSKSQCRCWQCTTSSVFRWGYCSNDMIPGWWAFAPVPFIVSVISRVFFVLPHSLICCWL